MRAPAVACRPRAATMGRNGARCTLALSKRAEYMQIASIDTVRRTIEVRAPSSAERRAPPLTVRAAPAIYLGRTAAALPRAPPLGRACCPEAIPLQRAGARAGAGRAPAAGAPVGRRRGRVPPTQAARARAPPRPPTPPTRARWAPRAAACGLVRSTTLDSHPQRPPGTPTPCRNPIPPRRPPARKPPAQKPLPTPPAFQTPRPDSCTTSRPGQTLTTRRRGC